MTTSNHQRRSPQSKRCSVRCPQRIGLRAARSHVKSAVKSAETADATALFLDASRAIDPHNFSAKRPVFRPTHETRSHGILEEVVPLPRVALVAAQEVIVEAGLPERSELLAPHAQGLETGSVEHSVQVSLQSFDPSAQSGFASTPETDKEMDVIGHDHVATDTDAELFGAAAVIDKTVMHRLVRKDGLAPMGVKRHQENRRVEPLEDQIETRGFVFDHWSHGNRCSVRCPQRTSSRAWRRSGKSAQTADATAQSAEDSGRYSASQPDRAFGWRLG